MMGGDAFVRHCMACALCVDINNQNAIFLEQLYARYHVWPKFIPRCFILFCSIAPKINDGRVLSISRLSIQGIFTNEYTKDSIFIEGWVKS